MASRVDVAEVHLWGQQMGAVAWDSTRDLARFEYHPEFLRTSTLEAAPLTMARRSGIFEFPQLRRETYHGLPGLLADSLPDRFGAVLIDEWLKRQNRSRGSFSPVEQLCYVGSRGMGALEYRPAMRGMGSSNKVAIDELADLAAEVLAGRYGLSVDLDDSGLHELLQVGTSAGGARAKAVIAWNPTTGEVRSGQVDAPEGFESWILKFDGVGSGDHGLKDPQGYGRIEYAYHLMAVDCGIEMTPSRLEIDSGNRAHFMSRRFDRGLGGNKLHMQSLSAIAHLDFNEAGAHSYEQALSITQQLGIDATGVEQLFRRMVFNVVARNQDDHTKNIAYLMDQKGTWALAPAFDVIWAFNPAGEWTSRHQMTINGKRDGIIRDDLLAVAKRYTVRDARQIIDDTVSVVAGWPKYASEAGVDAYHTKIIRESHRLF